MTEVQSVSKNNTLTIEPGAYQDNVVLHLSASGAVFDRDTLVAALGGTPTPDLTAVKRALFRMPYLPLTGHRSSSVHTMTDLVNVLDKFAEVLRDVAERNRETVTERDSLLRQRAAVREFWGV